MRYKWGHKLVLYHAVSSYQLLEVMLHRMQVHLEDRAILLLPDFIVEKYPQYKKLRTMGFFHRVYLLPYLHIPHGQETEIVQAITRHCRRILPYPLPAFSRVYVAGAHFYFSLCLIHSRIPFTFFEDGAGMLSQPERLHRALSAGFPVHAALAQKYGLYTGENPWVQNIICLKRAQTVDVSGPKYVDFSVEAALRALSPQARRQVVHFFLPKPLEIRGQAILLTQQFARLGRMTLAQQRQLYRRLGETVLQGIPLAVKVHPDDTLDYGEIFPAAQLITVPFPAELLPYVGKCQPTHLYALDSAGCENLGSHFILHKIHWPAWLEGGDYHG